MRTVGIIPARMGSSRFPGKPLAPILGIPMIGHVWARSQMSPSLDALYLATCDDEIAAYGKRVGMNVIMTSPTHPGACDRVAEAVQHVERGTGEMVDIVVMIQGDEPMLVPEMIGMAVRPMRDDANILVVNLMAPLTDREEHEDPNEVKVVVDRQQFALYFSREPIPSQKKGATEIPIWKQVCIIPFRRHFLEQFNAMERTPLEQIESVDMLRVLEHGYCVKMVPEHFTTYSVDTPEDLRAVEETMASDPLIAAYRGTMS